MKRDLDPGQRARAEAVRTAAAALYKPKVEGIIPLAVFIIYGEKGLRSLADPSMHLTFPDTPQELFDDPPPDRPR